MASSSARTKEYNKTVQFAQLEGIMMRSSSFTALPEFFAESKKAARYVRQTVLHEPNFDAQSGFQIGTIHCRMWMNKIADKALADKSPEDGFAKGLFAVEAVYAVIFKIPEQPEPYETSVLNEFFSKMATFATWPYFRSFVAHIATEAGLEVPVLPIKKLMHPVKEAGGYVDPDETRHVDRIVES